MCIISATRSHCHTGQYAGGPRVPTGGSPGLYGSEPPRPGALNAVPGPETGHRQ